MCMHECIASLRSKRRLSRLYRQPFSLDFTSSSFHLSHQRLHPLLPFMMLFLYCWIPLYISALLAISSAQIIKPLRNITSSGEQVQMNMRYIDRNTVSYNGWTISGCGSIPAMTEELNGVLGFLFQIKPHLEALIADVNLGTRSSHGYTAFFRTSTNIRTVMNKYHQ